MSSSPPPWRERIQTLLEPAQIETLAVYHFVAVALEIIFRRRQPLQLFNVSKVRDEAFSRFWTAFTAPSSIPQELKGSATLIPPLFAKAEGDVLEVGPGSGSQIQYFSNNVSIRKLYGAEPAAGLHSQILENATKAGFKGRYHILPCSADPKALIPTLTKEGIIQEGKLQDGYFDTIVTVRVLCSVPNPQETVEYLYGLLRPGGRLLVAEHVVNPWRTPQGSIVARGFQLLYSILGWSFFVGDCSLQRETHQVLIDVASSDGGWASNDLKTYFWWSALPYVSGALVKR